MASITDLLKGVGTSILNSATNMAQNNNWGWADGYSSTPAPAAGGGGGSSWDTPAATQSTGQQYGPYLSDALAGQQDQFQTALNSMGSTSGGASGLDANALKNLLASGQAQLSSIVSAGDTAKSQADAQRSLVEQSAKSSLEQAQKLRDATLTSADQRTQFLGDQYAQNKASGEAAYGASVQTANEKAQLSLQDIDDALAQTLPTLEHNKTNVIEDTEKTRTNIDDTLRRQFEGRNAVDSTFYGKATAEATADLYRQRNDQLFQIDQSISGAKTNAESQKRAVNTDLNGVLRDLEIRKNDQLNQLDQAYRSGLIDLDEVKRQANLSLDQFATDAEIKKIGQLQQIQFNLDDYLNGLTQRQADVRSQLASAGVTGVDFSADPSNANAFIQQLANAQKRL